MTIPPKKDFVVLEHSGDLRLEAWGDDELAAIAHASSALVDQIVPLEAIAEREEWIVTAPGDDAAAQIIALLNELVYLIDGKKWLPARVRTLTRCSRAGCRELEAVLVGEPLDSARHPFKYDVKAVTYHDFELIREPHRVVIRFVCDL